MPATRLSIYNGALTLIGERMLLNTSENREPRRLLDAVWDDSLIDYVLKQAMWRFATRSVQVDYSPSVEPKFGYRRAFDQPTDLLRTVAICSDPYFGEPLFRFQTEARFWFCGFDTIYVRYISNDVTYGGDLSLWPVDFSKYVSAYMATQVCLGLTNSSSKLKEVIDIMNDRLLRAKAVDAMESPTTFMPRGSWIRARNRGVGSQDGGRWG